MGALSLPGRQVQQNEGRYDHAMLQATATTADAKPPNKHSHKLTVTIMAKRQRCCSAAAPEAQGEDGQQLSQGPDPQLTLPSASLLT